jgi:hypothetical protein
MTSVGVACGVGEGEGLTATRGVVFWHAEIKMLNATMAMSRSTKRAV